MKSLLIFKYTLNFQHVPESSIKQEAKSSAASIMETAQKADYSGSVSSIFKCFQRDVVMASYLNVERRKQGSANISV